MKDGFTSLAYGSDGGFPGADVAKAVGGGASFFTGGQAARSTATQVVDVSGKVPAGTRSARVSMIAVRGAGSSHDGNVDNVSLVFR